MKDVVIQNGIEDFLEYFQEATEEKTGELPPYDESIPRVEPAEQDNEPPPKLNLTLDNEELSEAIVNFIDFSQKKLMSFLLERSNFTREERIKIQILKRIPEENLTEEEAELLMDYDYLKRKIEEQIPFSEKEKQQLKTAFKKLLESVSVEMSPGKYLFFTLLMVLIGSREP